MNRRTATTAPQPRLTGGDDRPQPACADNPEPFDQLIEHGVTRSTRFALRMARDLCGGCPIRDTCLDANRDERWAQAVLDAPPRHPLPPGSRTGAGLARYNRTRARVTREKRLPALRGLVSAGSTVDDACDLFGIERDTLRVWCQRNGHLDLYRALSGRKGWAA